MDDIDDVFDKGRMALARLTALMAEETRLIAAGQINDGLALAAEKAETADIVAVMLASLKVLPAPRLTLPQIEILRQQVEAMQETIAANLAVLATARSVSENLLRDCARRLAPPSPSAYGPHAAGANGVARAAGAPLIISRAT